MLTYSLSRSLFTNHKPSAHWQIAAIKFVYAQLHATDEIYISCAIIQVTYRGKDEIRINISTLVTKDGITQHIYDLTLARARLRSQPEVECQMRWD